MTAEAWNCDVKLVADVGVAGLHRLLHQVQQLDDADALVVVAGMEGALPSVVGGLVGCPVIAVPTSIGYGAHFHGLAALLGMLNSLRIQRRGGEHRRRLQRRPHGRADRAGMGQARRALGRWGEGLGGWRARVGLWQVAKESIPENGFRMDRKNNDIDFRRPESAL